jgi:hypothetical protein
MRRIIFTLALLVSLLSLHASNINHIATAFKSGNAFLLEGCLADKVEITYDGSKKQYTKTEATNLFTSFFEKNKAKTYSIIHQAEKKERGFYVALFGAEAKEYRINITYLAQGGSISIQSIRIE